MLNVDETDVLRIAGCLPQLARSAILSREGRSRLSKRYVRRTKLIERSTEELLAIIGSARSQHTADEIAAAETELRARTSTEPNLQVQKLRRAGLICALVGGLLFGWGAIGGAVFGATILKQAPAPPESSSFMFRHFNLLFVGTALLEAALGLALLIGGLAVRRLRRWGVKPILFAIWGFIAFCIVFTIEWIVTLFTEFGHVGAVGMVMSVFALAMAAFWVFLLYLPIRYFRSDRVRNAFATVPPNSR